MPEDDIKLPSKEELLDTLEPKAEETVTDAPVMSEREVQASSFGWKPKDKWVEEGGDPEDWRPAKDFLERGEMIGKIRSLTRETQEVQRALKHVAEQNKKIYQTGYQQAVTDLKAQRKEALAEGDFVRADELDEKIDAAKEELAKVQAQPVVPNQVDPGFVTWVEQNPWYNDPIMRKFSDALAIEFVNVNGGRPSMEETREYVEKTVKKEFAHKFAQAQKPVAAPSPDGNGRQTSSQGTQSNSLSKIEAGMSEMERDIMKTMIKRAGMTKQEYLKMYSEAR